ncbi:hypothetical protein MPSEU_000132500 [Mayamaea pseudoterrestris]|nr:hypothetical protein MPSEU_000132500 [Mayamaea pseudoterrestris]
MKAFNVIRKNKHKAERGASSSPKAAEAAAILTPVVTAAVDEGAPQSPLKEDASPPSLVSSVPASVASSNIKVFIDSKELQETLSSKSLPQIIGAIDQGTSSTRFVLVSQHGRILASAQLETRQYYPQPGWHEQDPSEIIDSVMQCVKTLESNPELQPLLAKHGVKAIGITNQRETTLVWNRVTGLPYYKAIVWDDLRTTEIAQTIRRHVASKDYSQNKQQQNGNSHSSSCSMTRKTGLLIASYFSGTKVRWLVENVPELAKDLQEHPEQVCFGTVDVWLAYQLTGKEVVVAAAAAAAATTNGNGNGDATSHQLHKGGLFVTDATNASRWLFMDLITQTWDDQLIDTVVGSSNVKVPISALPEIHSSSHTYGTCSSVEGIPKMLHNVPLSAILGDQQAALFGQTCFLPGEAKNTYGTGLFLMMVTGDQPVTSTHGLLTTIGYKIGKKTTYALEGSVAHSGSTIQWLRDQLQIIDKASDTESLAKPQNDGMYFVPAFAGLFAPYWRPDARACIVGMTSSHDKGHLCRATLEAIAYQTKDVFDAIEKDSNVSLKSLRVDGGGTANNLLMQFQSDIINVPVECPVVLETTAMGTAFAAGLAVGVWKDLDQIKALWSVAKTFEPQMSEQVRLKNLRGWDRAVSKSLGWVGDNNQRKRLSRMESELVEADYEDAFSDEDDLQRSIESLDTKRVEVVARPTETRMAWHIFSHILLTAAAVGAGYLLGERRPGLLAPGRFKLPAFQLRK